MPQQKTLKLAKILPCALDSTEMDDLFRVDGFAAPLSGKTPAGTHVASEHADQSVDLDKLVYCVFVLFV